MFSTITRIQGPREKLIKLGVETLTTQELFAIILNSGTQSHSITYISKKVEQLISSTLTTSISMKELIHIHGIGKMKACVILSVIELSQRLASKAVISITSPQMVGALLYDLSESKKETVVCLYLSARQTLLHKEILAVGSLNQSIISPREIFMPIRNFPIAYIILVHNHPSGDPTPSNDDQEFTSRVKKASEIIGINLLDHIILAKQQIYSMKEHGYL